jgi:transcriptional regulator with XRE-family HTH domain
MLKLSFHHTSLGIHLQQARKDRQLTQSALAQQAMISIPTIRLLENGQGTLTSFWSVLEALNVEIAGRNLPAGESIGERIITLRKRKGISQRQLVQVVNISQPTLIELERHCTGRLPTLDRVLTVLGAGAYLASPGSPQAFYVHAGNSSTSVDLDHTQRIAGAIVQRVWEFLTRPVFTDQRTYCPGESQSSLHRNR